MIPKAKLGYYLCQHNDSLKSYVLDLATRTIVTASKLEKAPMEYGFQNTCVAIPHLPPSFGLDVAEDNIPKPSLSTAQSVYAKSVLKIGTHVCTNDNEIYACIYIRTTKNIESWFLLETFLRGRKDRVSIHKQLLYQFLDTYFEYNTNGFHPCFVRSDISLAPHKRFNRVVSQNYPGIIISHDPGHPTTPYGTLLFEDDNPKICDRHDCAHSDIVKFNQKYMVASLGEAFTENPGIPRSYEHMLTFPKPYRDLWLKALAKEYNGLFVERDGVTPCTPEYIMEYMRKHPKTLKLRAHLVFTIKANGDFKVRCTGDGRGQRIALQKILGTKSPYAIKYYSPSVNDETLMWFLWQMVQYPKELCYSSLFDYSQAYLNSRNDSGDVIFFMLPPGVLLNGQKQGILNIYLYGMLESGLRWNEILHESIMKNFPQFTRNESDPTLYTFISAVLIVLLLVNVDDCLLHVVGENAQLVGEKLIADLNADYPLTVSSNIDFFLGLNLTWAADKSWVKVSLRDKIETNPLCGLSQSIEYHCLVEKTCRVNTG